jgi:hypothetical protein
MGIDLPAPTPAGLDLDGDPLPGLCRGALVVALDGGVPRLPDMEHVAKHVKGRHTSC